MSPGFYARERSAVVLSHRVTFVRRRFAWSTGPRARPRRQLLRLQPDSPSLNVSFFLQYMFMVKPAVERAIGAFESDKQRYRLVLIPLESHLLAFTTSKTAAALRKFPS